MLRLVQSAHGRDVSVAVAELFGNNELYESQKQWQKYFDPGLISEIEEYIRRFAPVTETIRCEGVGHELKNDRPRHYDLIDFVCEYGADYPGIRAELAQMLEQYFEQLGFDPKEAINQINVAAAMKCLLMIIEKPELKNTQKQYLEKAMTNIQSGELFLNGFNSLNDPAG